MGLTDHSLNAETYSGVVVALVTPLNDDESVDVSSLCSLLEWVIAGGVKGVFIGGTAGEGPALRDAERQTLYLETVRQTARRIPVLANVSDISTTRALDQVAMATATGVDGVVVTPRFAFPQRTAEESVLHLQAIARSSSIPVWFYENPFTTGVASTFDILQQVMNLPNVAGLKYSSADKELFVRCVEAFAPDQPVMTGNVSDITYAARIGATGAVSGLASLAPISCVSAFEMSRLGRADDAQGYQSSINSLYAIYGGTGWPLWPGAQKYLLKRKGIIASSAVTAPFRKIGPEQEHAIDQALELIGVNIEEII